MVIETLMPVRRLNRHVKLLPHHRPFRVGGMHKNKRPACVSQTARGAVVALWVSLVGVQCGQAADHTRAPSVADAQKSEKPPPTYADVSYGPHALNVLDVWLAPHDGPHPLLVFIHGGGWLGGDKRALTAGTLAFMLEHGVSVAAINYRTSTVAPLPGPVHDAARAVQFLRSKAAQWKLDSSHVAATGGSAGGCTTLWLNYHADLADPKSPDPIAHESTRLCAAVGMNPQTAIDPRLLSGWVGDEVLKHPMLSRAVGAKDGADMMAHYAQFSSLFAEFSPYTHVSSDDPPALLIYLKLSPLPAINSSIAIHHSTLGQKLKEKADECGAYVRLSINELGIGGSEANEFLIEHLQTRRP
jgi:arylformamidase